MNTLELVDELKDNNQDFEWYPTTEEMIDIVKRWIPEDATSIMDIGAGDGRVLESFAKKCKRATLYSIEKSPILIQAQSEKIVPVGTELFEQQLSALEVDYIYCNPRYTEFDEWMCKVIEEGYAQKAFLTVPQRWKDSKTIKKAIELRGAETRIIYSGDFLGADRKSRALIDIVEITFPGWLSGYTKNVTHPFNIWFDNNIDTFDKPTEIVEDLNDEELAKRYSVSNITEMVAAYREEYKRLESNYRGVFKLDATLLREVGVNKATVRDGLKKKLKGLKVRYWRLLFTRLDAIRERLTTKSKNALMEKLTRHNTIEFTASNAYTIVLWAIKNANQFLDDQAVDLFRQLATYDGIMKYKSNQKTWERSGWRYQARQGEFTHYILDYRIIVEEFHAIQKGFDSDWEFPGGIHNNAHNIIADIIAVMSNLGFKTYSLHSHDRKWKGGKWQDWYDDRTDEILFQVKGYMNGNIHIRFNQEAIKALNITVGRILKWVNTVDDVVQEMGYTRREATKYFNYDMKILTSNVRLLGAPAEEEKPEVEEPEDDIKEVSLSQLELLWKERGRK